MKTVYIETSIISYLTAKPSDNLMASAWQKATVDWWEIRRDGFQLYTSQLVLDEASQGDPTAAQRRLDALEDISLLETTESVIHLAKSFINQKILPPKAIGDAIHIAVTIIHELDYLLTWNCRHIDNAETKPAIRNTFMIQGLPCPEICTPQELMGEQS